MDRSHEMNHHPTPPTAGPAQDGVPCNPAATTEPAPDERETIFHRRVVRALATRPPLTGLVVFDYGLRYAALALRTGTRWALFFAAAGVLCFCAVLGAPGLRQPFGPNLDDDATRAQLAPNVRGQDEAPLPTLSASADRQLAGTSAYATPENA
jgi:hypothetical protein